MVRAPFSTLNAHSSVLLLARYSAAPVRGLFQPFLFTDTWIVGRLSLQMMLLMMVLLQLGGFKEVHFLEMLGYLPACTLPLLLMVVVMIVPHMGFPYLLYS